MPHCQPIRPPTSSAPSSRSYDLKRTALHYTCDLTSLIGHRSSPRARSRARGRHTTCAGQKSDAAKAWRASWSETHRAARRICSWTLRPSRPLRFLRSHLPGGRKPHALSIRWMKSLGAEAHLDGHVLRVVRLEEDDLGADRLHARRQLLHRVDAAVIDEQHAPGPRPRGHVLELPRIGRAIVGEGCVVKGGCRAPWWARRAHHGAVDRVEEALLVEGAIDDVHALEAGLRENAEPGVLPAASENVQVRHGRATTLRAAAVPVGRLLVAPDLVDTQQRGKSALTRAYQAAQRASLRAGFNELSRLVV
eukprot:scaffold25893_cov35-Phaeocystis_antarctica.AAC.2